MPPRSRQISLYETLASLAGSDFDKTTLAPRHRGFTMLKAHAGPAFLGKSLESLSHDNFQVVLDHYRTQNPAHNTGKRLIAEFNAILAWAVASGHRDTPFTPYRLPPGRSLTSKTLSPDQVNSLLLFLDQNYRLDFIVRIAVRALVYLGLGVTETAYFTLDHVNINTWEYVQQDTQGRHRFIPIPSSMRPLLRHARGLPELINRGIGKDIWIDQTTLRVLVRDLGERCGIHGLTPDQLRWTAIYGE